MRRAGPQRQLEGLDRRRVQPSDGLRTLQYATPVTTSTAGKTIQLFQKNKYGATASTECNLTFAMTRTARRA